VNSVYIIVCVFSVLWVVLYSVVVWLRSRKMCLFIVILRLVRMFVTWLLRLVSLVYDMLVVVLSSVR